MQRILVTGASRGIGAAIARELANRGAQVVLHAHRNPDLARALADSLPGDHRVEVADLEDPEAVVSLFDRAGSLTGLVNNAGVYEPHPPLSVDLATWRAHWDRTLAINLRAAADLTFLAARAGVSRVVQISSRGAFRGEPDAPAYGASKAGMNALSGSMARALAAEGIYFFVVAPGWVDTDMAGPHLDADVVAGIPLGRAATPDEIASTVGFCLYDAPPSMTGAIIDVNGASCLRS
jgi:NAD(P)-dependent dehydrogenase (short-subunit alcohol dehydrogenase family)